MEKLIPTKYAGQFERGGSTKPWKVFAIKTSEIVEPIELPYAVKLFSPNTVKQHPCIAKEFICNALATEFDLLVPNPGIINLNTPEFLKTLSRKEVNDLKERFDGNTFASELLNGPIVSENVRNTFSDMEDRAMIYAFDAFILNVDRWGIHQKPNLILHNESFLLIDHELSLSFIGPDNRKTLDLILNSIKNGSLLYQYKNHLFYKSLTEFTGEKSMLFNTFQQYLLGVSIIKIKTLINELEMNEIDVGNIFLLFEYIREIKSLSGKFCEALLKSIL